MSGKAVGGSKPLVVRGIIDRLEGDFAVIITDSGEDLLWPSKRLADGARPGVAVVLTMVTDHDETARREAEVRGLLRDIFESKSPEQ